LSSASWGFRSVSPRQYLQQAAYLSITEFGVVLPSRRCITDCTSPLSNLPSTNARSESQLGRKLYSLNKTYNQVWSKRIQQRGIIGRHAGDELACLHLADAGVPKEVLPGCWHEHLLICAVTRALTKWKSITTKLVCFFTHAARFALFPKT
jgi:hypothetical protein